MLYTLNILTYINNLITRNKKKNRIGKFTAEQQRHHIVAKEKAFGRHSFYIILIEFQSSRRLDRFSYGTCTYAVYISKLISLNRFLVTSKSSVIYEFIIFSLRLLYCELWTWTQSEHNLMDVISIEFDCSERLEGGMAAFPKILFKYWE